MQHLADVLSQKEVHTRASQAEVVPVGAGNVTPFPESLARSVSGVLSASEPLPAEGGALVADEHGDLQYLGANSLSSVASEAGDVAQRTLRSKLPLLSGRSRTEASDLLKRFNHLQANIPPAFLENNLEELPAGEKGLSLPEHDVALRLSTGTYVPFRPGFC